MSRLIVCLPFSTAPKGNQQTLLLAQNEGVRIEIGEFVVPEEGRALVYMPNSGVMVMTAKMSFYTVTVEGRRLRHPSLRTALYAFMSEVELIE